MPINFDVVIDTPDPSIDMKAGLETFQGISDATRLIAETILNEHVPQRLSYRGKVRTNLKESFKGSYGQIFDLAFYDEGFQAKFDRIGKAAFLQLMQYLFNESLYDDQHAEVLSPRALAVLDALGDVSEDLVRQLRLSSLERIHQVSVKFGYDTRLRFRKNGRNQTLIAKFDTETVNALEATEDPEIMDLNVSITRLNINTGNGRFVEEGKYETVPFGFAAEYKLIRLASKKLFSENLNHNNGLDQADWRTLIVSARAIRLRDEKIVKYIITGFRP
jgi:hypothetical protein